MEPGAIEPCGCPRCGSEMDRTHLSALSEQKGSYQYYVCQWCALMEAVYLIVGEPIPPLDVNIRGQ